jgi:hypothetical protein
MIRIGAIESSDKHVRDSAPEREFFAVAKLDAARLATSAPPTSYPQETSGNIGYKLVYHRKLRTHRQTYPQFGAEYYYYCFLKGLTIRWVVIKYSARPNEAGREGAQLRKGLAHESDLQPGRAA